MPAAGAGVDTPAVKPGVPRLGSIAQTAPADVTQCPLKQVKPATVDDPIHALPTVGVIHVKAMLQSSDPDTLPSPMQYPPDVALPAPAIHVAPLHV